MNQSRSWTVKEVASILEVHHNTIRRWATLIETKGYMVNREQRGNIQVRLFSDKDISVLEHLRDAANEPGVSVDEAASLAIASALSSSDKPALLAEASQTTELSSDTANAIMQRLDFHEQQLNAQLGFNKELVERLEKNLAQQNQYIENSIRRRDEQLTQVLRTFIEAAATQKEENDRKKRWWRRTR